MPRVAVHGIRARQQELPPPPRNAKIANPQTHRHPIATTPPPPAATPPPSPLDRVALSLLVAVALLQIAAFAWYVPGNDWARDLFMAARIADGGEFPLRGPIIAGTAHLGPAWYWLLALPVGCGFGFTGTALFVGALATLKVPLAWRLGGELGGRALALPFAALMLLPGWNLLTSLQLTHTALLETLLLAAALPLLALWRGGGARSWLGFGVLAGLAVHAHPVAGFLVVPAGCVLWRRKASGLKTLPQEAAMLVGGVLLALLPLGPMLVAEMRDGFPALAAIANAESAVQATSLPAGFVSLLAANTIGVIAPVRAFAPATWHGAIAAGFVFVTLAAAIGVPTLWRSPARHAWLATLALWLLAAAWLVAVRATVPFYMAALLWPLQMLALAWPLAALATRARAGTAVAWAAIVVALALAIVANAGLMATMQSGHAALPLATIHDIRTQDPPRTPLALMPIWAFDRVARESCGDRTLIVHGELAALVDFYQGIPFTWTCTNTIVALGGTPEGEGIHHWAGATPHTLRTLGFADADWDAALAFAPRQVVAPVAALPLVADARYPHRASAAAPVATQRFAFAAGADAAVAVHAPLFAFDGTTVQAARCNGVEIAAASRTNSGALFLPPAGTACAWAIDVATRAPAQVDVVTLPLGPRR